MSDPALDSTTGGHLPNLQKVSVALLEHLVEPVLGKEAIKELKEPHTEKELRETLAKSLAHTEARFIEENGDEEVRKAVLGLPLATLPSLAKAVGDFYARPTDTALSDLQKKQLSLDFPQISKERINEAVESYLLILREELIPVSEEIRSKLVALGILSIEKETKRMAEGIDKLSRLTATVNSPRPGNAPRPPSLIIGRVDDMRELKTRLGIIGDTRSTPAVQILTAPRHLRDAEKETLAAVRGWPGVGKTTLAAALAYDSEVTVAFPDGILWVSLGQTPNVLSELATWGRALGTDDLLHAKTIEEASAQLAALLRNKRMLLIVDDVWDAQHALPFKVGGLGCATLVTTRESGVAQALAPTPNDVYRLNVLTQEKALELLQALTPSVVASYPKESRELVDELEGLPLALQVAGHLLQAEANMGFSVTDLLVELRAGAALLAAKAPADRTDLANETTPTVAVLLQRSTDRLDSLTRDCYAYLGPFAPKPATFDLEAMKAVWEIEDPKPIARTLVERGLLEPVPETGRFQMHALLVMHAKSLLTPD